MKTLLKIMVAAVLSLACMFVLTKLAFAYWTEGTGYERHGPATDQKTDLDSIG